MEYIILILLLIYGIVKYDIKSKKNVKYEYLVLFILFFLSAFQYHIGADIFSYEYEYIQGYSINDINDLYSHIDNRRQPAWVLLICFLRFFSDDFLLFKIIQALFINYSIYRLIKHMQLPIYMTLLMYFLFIYPNLNFNTLRQSFAVALFAYAIPYLESKKWIPYYICCFLAFMFHNSAIVLFVLPFSTLIKTITIKHVLLVTIFMVALYLIFMVTNANSILITLLGTLNLGDNMTELGIAYLENDKYFRTRGFVMLGHIIVWLIPISYYIKNNIGLEKYSFLHNPLFKFLCLISVVFYFLDSYVPIFYRFNLYLILIYYGYASCMIIEHLKHPKKYLISAILIMLYIISPSMSYFRESSVSGNRLIDQYYPWHSVYSKETEAERELLYNKYNVH